MPGLIDAHAHVGFVEQNFADDTENRHPGAIYGYSVARNIEDTLMHGFTTIRDAGGCDWSFKLAVERGMIKGPRMFVSNSFISRPAATVTCASGTNGPARGVTIP